MFSRSYELGTRFAFPVSKWRSAVRGTRIIQANGLVRGGEEQIMLGQVSGRFLVATSLAIGVAAPAFGAPIDLNDFFADPTVTVEADGSSAIMAEDPALLPVLLSNDPGLGDPEVILAGPGVVLSFDFDFVEGGPGNNDEFGAFVLDSSGAPAGPAFEFFTSDTDSGSVSFDLSSLVSEPSIGLQFQLSALPGDLLLESVVTIRNVRTEVTQAIPEPTTLMLLILGAICTVVGSRSRSRLG